MVLGELRMQHDIEKAAERDGFHSGHAGDRLWIEDAVADDAEPSRALGDQHGPVGQKRQAPWIDQILRHQAHANPVLGRLERKR